MAISLVISVSAASSTTAGITTGSVNTTGATGLIAMAGTAINQGTVTDSKGNTWNGLTTHVNNGGNVYGQLFWCIPTSVGSGHTFSLGGVASYAALSVLAFSGTDTTTLFDSHENGVDNTSAATMQPGSITPGDTTNDVSVVGVCYLDSVSCSSVAGYTLQENQASDGTVTHVGSSIAYLVGTGGATNPVITPSSGTPRASACIASFKFSAGGGGGGTNWGSWIVGNNWNRIIQNVR